MSLRKTLLDWLKTTILAIAAAIFLHYFVCTFSTVSGRSMEPTLHEKQWVFVNKAALWFGPPKTGDIIVLEDPSSDSGEDKFLVKRVIGAPGDRIEISGGKLYRNGQLVDEPYTDTLIEEPSYGPVEVGDDHYFVMGDNRRRLASLDSRSFQAVPRELIIGQVDGIVWPLREIRFL